MASSPAVSSQPLPPGQRLHPEFPRFGLTPFATRFPRELDRLQIVVARGDNTLLLSAENLQQLPRVSQRSDFHCVTSWSQQNLHWSGWRFRDVHQLVCDRMGPAIAAAQCVVLRSQDGYHSSLPLADLLADDVLLADQLDGQLLGIAHGAPLRLIAPAHYGYKSVKHLCRIEFLADPREYWPLGPRLLRFMVHPRGRVALEERGRWFPGWLLRQLYRPLIAPTARRFAHALQEHEQAPR